MSIGVLIFKGMKVGVLPGDLVISISESGSADSKLVLSTAYNVLPLWLRIAHEALARARAASQAIANTWGSNEETNRKLLVAELTPTLQVFVACGIALDALYDQLRPHAKLEEDLLVRWRSNKTSRARQVAEVVRRVFGLNADVHAQFSQNIGEVMKWRDQAVHPSLELKNSCTRPDIAAGVDWKFSLYRYSNGELCFRAAMSMLIYLYEHRSKITEVDEQIHNVFEALQELGVVTLNAEDGTHA